MIGQCERVVLKSDPDCETEIDTMEFRLTYEGRLFGASGNNKRAKHKHEIRKVFHKQLRRIFELHPAYEYYRLPEEGPEAEILNVKKRFDNMIEQFERCGYQFFPLATRNLSLLCSINILFLRPDVPGGAIRSGDIDNRMKTIFDALRIPATKEELGGYDIPGKEEKPFFCLLEDDSLISHAAVETDTLLQPTGESWDSNDARLVVTVRLSPYRVTFANLVFS